MSRSHSTTPSAVFGGALFLFLATAFVGLFTRGMIVPLPNLFPAPSGLVSEGLFYSIEPSPEFPFPEMRLSLVVVFFVSTFIVAPVLITNLYRSALKQYQVRAD